MNAESRVSRVGQDALIRILGEQLDNDIFPSVRTGGVLVPAGRRSVEIAAGKENQSAESASRSRRPSAGSWAGAAGRSGTTRRSPDPPSPSVSEHLRRSYETQLDAFKSAYPGTKVWKREDGMWLLVRSAVLSGLQKSATFLILLPYIGGIRPFGWGFWQRSGRLEWIGPRHTNFREGSICAYTLDDKTWEPGGDIVTLVDLYTLWAFRHLHLKMFNRWPGAQSAPHAYERVMEFRRGEFCGCGTTGVLYSRCCQASDSLLNLELLATDFRTKHGCDLAERDVPATVWAILKRWKDPPTAISVILELI